MLFQAITGDTGDVLRYEAMGLGGRYTIYEEPEYWVDNPATATHVIRSQKVWQAIYMRGVDPLDGLNLFGRQITVGKDPDRQTVFEAVNEYEQVEARRVKWAQFMRDHDPADILNHFHRMAAPTMTGPALWLDPADRVQDANPGMGIRR